MNRSFWYKVIYFSTYPWMALTHPMKFIGREHIPEGASLICGNHTGLMDPMIACYAITKKRELQPMAKQELRSVPIVGKVLEWGGAIYVDRGNTDVKTIKSALNCLKEGRKLLIYPEGGRKAPGHEWENVKTGAAFFATRCQVPILPMYIPREKKYWKPLVIRMGEPFTPEIAGKKATPEELDSITQEIIRRVEALKAQDQVLQKQLLASPASHEERE